MEYLDVIIVNWNTVDLLEQCLLSLGRSMARCNRFDVAVHVVDNGSTDESATMVRSAFPWVHLVENQYNLGFVRANNQIIRELTGHHVLLLNSDAMLLPDTLEELSACLLRHPQAGVIGPTLLNADGTFQAGPGYELTLVACALKLLGISRLFYGAYYPSIAPDDVREGMVAWVGGACMLVRDDVIRQIGMLDENIIMYSEEVDLCHRTRLAGWDVISCPQARVLHIGGGSSSVTRPWVLARQWKSTVYIVSKHRGRMESLVLRLLILVLGLSRSVVFLVAAIAIPTKRVEYISRVHSNLNLALLRTNYDV